ncbi:DUF3606 domain-containing protein [Bradyrhizobium sp. CB82]|uniref:DUF3606 domain-containing protein n=1 Tax=Bradyrhizobium sp. CB82 TaxID=3039159 RepID=UPI0024B27631|nr:DUF3606 domain-containing protein [Bradyrhizobium sp. CB82]WFU42411.1 DUF3606 domain-containing protein [Bradyrhizobium sp. CB82]
MADSKSKRGRADCALVAFGERYEVAYWSKKFAGVPADGAAGSNFESLSKLNCTIDLNAIRRKDGSGASCSFQPGN